MKRIALVSAVCLTLFASLVSAGQLQRTDFAGIQPFTFDGFATATSPYDFGDFTLANFFDMDAFLIPRELPVELPTPGGENLILTLATPTTAIGMDVGVGADVYFYGENDVLLAVISAGDIAVWPIKNGFAGYSDDAGQLIYWVQIGTFDAFVDNVYLGSGAVATDEGSFGQIKGSYR